MLLAGIADSGAIAIVYLIFYPVSVIVKKGAFPIIVTIRIFNHAKKQKVSLSNQPKNKLDETKLFTYFFYI